jgi:hypothetical protein
VSIVIYGTGTIHTIGKRIKKEAVLCKTLIGRDVFLYNGIETLINHSRYKNAVFLNQLKIRSKEGTNFLVGTTKPRYGCTGVEIMMKKK